MDAFDEGRKDSEMIRAVMDQLRSAQLQLSLDEEALVLELCVLYESVARAVHSLSVVSHHRPLAQQYEHCTAVVRAYYGQYVADAPVLCSYKGCRLNANYATHWGPRCHDHAPMHSVEDAGFRLENKKSGVGRLLVPAFSGALPGHLFRCLTNLKVYRLLKPRSAHDEGTMWSAKLAAVDDEVPE